MNKDINHTVWILALNLCFAICWWKQTTNNKTEFWRQNSKRVVHILIQLEKAFNIHIWRFAWLKQLSESWNYRWKLLGRVINDCLWKAVWPFDSVIWRVSLTFNNHCLLGFVEYKTSKLAKLSTFKSEPSFSSLI